METSSSCDITGCRGYISRLAVKILPALTRTYGNHGNIAGCQENIDDASQVAMVTLLAALEESLAFDG